MKKQFVNPDKTLIVVIGLVQLGIIFSSVLLAAVLSKGMDLKQVPQVFRFIRNWGLVLTPIPLIWSAVAAYICSARHTSARARTVAIVIGIVVCLLLFMFMGGGTFTILGGCKMCRQTWF